MNNAMGKACIMGFCLVMFLTSCTYMKYSSIQAEYARIQNADPSQVNLKHMLDKDTFFVYGKTIDTLGIYENTPMAIAAYSSKYKKNERVDTMLFVGSGTHFGLTLPEGDYTLLVYANTNKDLVFQPSEVVGTKKISLSLKSTSEKNLGQVNISLERSNLVAWADAIGMPKNAVEKQSIFFPSGTIRSLNDAIFDEKIATLGMYDPASFMEHAPTMFHALEENTAHKIPVIFVHGIGGSPRSFDAIIARMDLNRYKPWFFYYPSGGDLDQLADFFYDLFLSGKIIPLKDRPMIIVAHSMGGLVVREAINKYKGRESENRVELLVTIASPFGGHPAAAAGEKHGLIVLPAWRDLNPKSQFITNLYQKPLPTFMNHQLFYAFSNSSTLKTGDNSDGVVPLFSQLHPEAQKQSSEQFGFNSTHTGILKNEKMISHLLEKMDEVEDIFPASHMEILADGGLDIKLTDDYSPETQHLIHYAGKYLMLLVAGDIEPIHADQEHFIQAVRGERSDATTVETEFIQFMEEYSDLIHADF